MGRISGLFVGLGANKGEGAAIPLWRTHSAAVWNEWICF
jgi:hypothetical protein